jgi:hypothetical protein
MESYPHHYSCRPRKEDPIDSNLCFVLDELQNMEVRLGEKIEGRCSELDRRLTESKERLEGHCGGLERRAVESDQRAEECFILLEMAWSESK